MVDNWLHRKISTVWLLSILVAFFFAKVGHVSYSTGFAATTLIALGILRFSSK